MGTVITPAFRKNNDGKGLAIQLVQNIQHLLATMLNLALPYHFTGKHAQGGKITMRYNNPQNLQTHTPSRLTDSSTFSSDIAFIQQRNSLFVQRIPIFENR